MTRQAPDQVLAIPASELARQSGESLFQLKNDAADLLKIAKAVVDHIDGALTLKYADRAQALRLSANKDTGVVHFTDARVRVSAELSKKVEWDQQQLADIMQRITTNGDNPTDYIEVSYRVSESKFNAWPESIRSVFVPARTLKSNKPSFRLALLED